jgi:hypothetical protein
MAIESYKNIHMKYNLNAIIGLLCGCAIIGCNQLSSDFPAASETGYEIKKMPAIVKKPFEKLEVSAQHGGTLLFENGTEIVVPAGVLLCDGKPVTDIVTISLVQYSTPFEIFASGIPMQYDSAGLSYTFKSAGMINIQGDYQGRSLTVAPGKSLGVRMVSMYDDTEHSIYQFDTIHGQWINKGQDTVTYISVADTALLQERIDSLTTSSSNSPTNNLSLRKDVIPIILYDIERFPRLKVFSSIAFEIASQDFAKLGLAVSELWVDMQFDTTTMQATTTLKLMSTNKELSLKGKFLLDGEPYNKAMEQYPQKKMEYDQRIRERDSLMRIQRIAMQRSSAVSREFAASGFGIWNIDAAQLRAGMPVKLNLVYNDNPILSEVGLAYLKENSLFRLAMDETGAYPCRFLDSKLLVYASDTSENVYVGVISEKKAINTKRSSIVEVKMVKITEPALFFSDLKTQVDILVYQLEEELPPMEKDPRRDASEISMKLLPIPANEYFKIDISHYSDDLKVVVINRRGKAVISQSKYEPMSEIDISHLPEGIYSARVSSDALEYTKTEKILVDHSK